jgi:hypothetical protein
MTTWLSVSAKPFSTETLWRFLGRQLPEPEESAPLLRNARCLCVMSSACKTCSGRVCWAGCGATCGTTLHGNVSHRGLRPKMWCQACKIQKRSPPGRARESWDQALAWPGLGLGPTWAWRPGLGPWLGWGPGPRPGLKPAGRRRGYYTPRLALWRTDPLIEAFVSGILVYSPPGKRQSRTIHQACHHENTMFYNGFNEKARPRVLYTKITKKARPRVLYTKN